MATGVGRRYGSEDTDEDVDGDGQRVDAKKKPFFFF